MGNYVIKRLLLMIPTIFLVTVVVFMLVRFIPGGVIDQLVGQSEQVEVEDPEVVEARIRHLLGLDMPIHVQYVNWLSKIVRGDLGTSLWAQQSITEEMLHRLPVSLEIGVVAAITALIFAIPIGIYSAVRQDTWGDYAGRSIAIIAICLPSFWMGTMVMVYPSIWWKWSPAMEYIPLTENLAGNLLQFIVPGFIMGMLMSGSIMRMTRTMMLEVLKQDYIRTAWAKGLNERTVIVRHALRNALMPVVTMVGVFFPVMIGGSVVLEQIFSLPGVGRYLIEALNKRDYPVISGINLVLASVTLAVNLVVDLAYAYLDPRIQYR
jgi:peptide/nickel transport system permease protein